MNRRRLPRCKGVRVTFSRGDVGRALYVLSQIGELVESGRFTLPEVQTFPLANVAQAHRIGEYGHVRAKLVLHRGREHPGQLTEANRPPGDPSAL